MTTIPQNVIILWLGTHAGIPTGWSRETTLDAKYPKGTPDATNPGGTGGALAHSHTTGAHAHATAHTHTVPDSGTSSNSSGRDAGTTNPPVAHTHVTNPDTADPTTTLANATPATDSVNHEPPYREVIFIKSDGTPTGVPANAVTLWADDAGAPTDWNLCDGGAGRPNLSGRWAKGAAALGDAGGSGGNSSHTHTIASHDHATPYSHTHPNVTSSQTATALAVQQGTGSSAQVATATHQHGLAIGSVTAAITANTDSAAADNSEPPNWVLAFIQNNAGALSFPDKIIGLWLGTLATIPDNWKLCDGTNGTPDLRSLFVKGAATLGGIGGSGGSLTHGTGHTATGHTHPVASHQHTVTDQGNAASEARSSGATNAATQTHTHSYASTGAASFTSGSGSPSVVAYTDTQPPYVNVAFIQWQEPTILPQTVYPAGIVSTAAFGSPTLANAWLIDLQANRGSVLEDFETTTGWSATNGTIANNPDQFRSGTQSIKLTTNTGAQGYMTKTVAWDLSACQRVAFWAYLHSPLADYGGALRIDLSNDAGFGNYYRAWIPPAWLSVNFVSGWNAINWPLSFFKVGAGAPSWASTIIRVRFFCEAAGGKQVSVSFDELRGGIVGQPAMLLRFDDARSTTYTVAYPKLAAAGLVGSVAVESSQIGNAGYMTSGQLQELANAGWSLINHSDSGTSFLGQSQATVETRLATCDTALAGLGVHVAEKIVVYPNGDFDANTLAAMKAGHRWMAWLNSPPNDPDGVTPGVPMDLPKTALDRLPSETTGNTTLATLEGYVDAALAGGTPVAVLFHTIPDTTLTQANFEAFIDYIVASHLRALTIEDWYNLASRYAGTDGIPSSAALGSPTVKLKAQPAGLASTLAFGTTTIKLKAQPGGIGSALALGEPTVSRPEIQDVAPDPIASTLAFGTSKTALKVLPGAIGSGLGLGTPTVGRVAAIFYVDAAAGDDGKDGLSEANAWQTIGKVNAQTWVPGDQVLFKRGQTWANTTLTPANGGTLASPLSFGAYGAGARPALTHATSIAMSVLHDHIQIAGLYFASDAVNGNHALNLKAAHLTVDDCEIASARYCGINTNEPGSVVHQLTLTNNVVHGCKTFGIFLADSDGTAGNGPADILAEGNTCYQNGTSISSDHGIYCQYALRVTLRANVCYDNKCAGIKLNSAQDCVVENNRCYSVAARGTQQYGFFVDEEVSGDNRGNQWLNNLAYENVINLHIQVSGSVGSNLYYHNTFINGGTGLSGSGYGVRLTAVCAAQVLKNNIIFQDRATCGRYNSVYMIASATIIPNNTWDNNAVYYDDTANFAEVVSGTHKTFAEWQALTGSPDAHSVNANPLFRTVTATTTSVDANSASGQPVLNVADTTGFAANLAIAIDEGGARDEAKSILSVQAGVSLTLRSNLTNTHTAAQADPVTTRAYSDLHLLDGSPCREAGASGLGIALDLDGVARVDPPDIGAYEYVGLGQTVAPTGIASGGAFGTTKVTLKVVPNGIASGLAFGTSKVGHSVLPGGLASGLAFGTSQVGRGVKPGGIAAAAACGQPIVTLGSGLTARPTGLASGLAFGTAKVTLKVVPNGRAGSLGIGQPNISRHVVPNGLAGSVAFGTSKVTLKVVPNGRASTLLPGSPTIGAVSGLQAEPDGRPSTLAFGTLKAALKVLPQGRASRLVFGTPQVAHGLRVAGLAGALAFGTVRAHLTRGPADPARTLVVTLDDRTDSVENDFTSA